MIKVENIDVWGFEHAIRGMRNPMNSGNKSDSLFPNDFIKVTRIGENDLGLMKRLYKAGTEHRKYLRQIFVSMDITAPLYFWKEADQYKISTTTNSCSTMHSIHKKAFEVDDFSHEHLFNPAKLQTIVDWLNDYRDIYINWDENVPWKDDNERPVTKKDVWWQLIQLLPSSYNQRRTWTGSYENLITMYNQRKNHKLDEWCEFCKIILELPYMKEIMGVDNE